MDATRRSTPFGTCIFRVYFSEPVFMVSFRFTISVEGFAISFPQSGKTIARTSSPVKIFIAGAVAIVVEAFVAVFVIIRDSPI